MSTERPDPFLDRASDMPAVLKAMGATGMRQVYVLANGEEIRAGPDGKISMNGAVNIATRVNIDWASVVRFTRAK